MFRESAARSWLGSLSLSLKERIVSSQGKKSPNQHSPGRGSLLDNSPEKAGASGECARTCRVAALVQEIEEEAPIRREEAGLKPLGVKEILAWFVAAYRDAADFGALRP